jgi:DNA replication protein DnaC
MVDNRPLRLDNVDYLAAEKHLLIDNCARCGGLDLQCHCYKKYDLEVRKVRACIPLKYRKADMSALKSKDIAAAKDSILAYTSKIRDNKKKGRGLYLWGSSGTAKTYSGCAVMISALSAGYSAYFTTMNDCIDNIVRSRRSSAAFITALQTVTFLMIDDIGYAYRPAKDEVAYVDSLLDRIIRQRCNDLLPVIATSHKSLNDLSELNSSGSRIASIAKEHMRRIQFTGPDYRDKMGI